MWVKFGIYRCGGLKVHVMRRGGAGTPTKTNNLLVNKTDGPAFTRFRGKAGPLDPWEPLLDNF